MSASCKVLMLVENNGYPRDFRVRREALALRDAGYDVRVICPREPGEPWVEAVDGVMVHRFPAPPGGRGPLGYAVEFAYATLVILGLSLWIALRRGVDVVHAANPPDTLFVVGAVFRLFGKRFIFDHHDLAPEIYLSRFANARPDVIHAVLRLLERCSYAVADVVIATNDSYRRRAVEQGGKAPEAVFVVRNGPPLSYKPAAPPADFAGGAEHLIGYVGTIGPQDGLDCWMRAIRHLVVDVGRRDFRAIVIGDGDALREVRALAAELDIEHYVHFTGRLSELDARRVLSAMTLCVQPDPPGPLNDHSTMNKLMEYMALGKATVAFDLPETRVSGGEAVSYVGASDELEFARRVDWLLREREERARMAEAGMRRVAGALAWEHSIPNLLNAYATALGKQAIPVEQEAR